MLLQYGYNNNAQDNLKSGDEYKEGVMSENHQIRADDSRQAPAAVTPSCGIIASNTHNAQTMNVRTNSDVAQQVRTNTWMESSWYQPRRAERSNMFGQDDETLRALERYKRYETRLASFMASSWPTTVPVSVEELARAGWYYTGVTDRVRCPWCHGCVYSWEAGDTGLGEHKRHFPNCTFVNEQIAKAFERPRCLSAQNKPSSSLPVTMENWRESNAVLAVQSLELHSDDVIENAVRHLLTDKRKRTDFNSFVYKDAYSLRAFVPLDIY